MIPSLQAGSLRGGAVERGLDRNVSLEKVRVLEEQANEGEYRKGEMRGRSGVGRLGYAAKEVKDPPVNWAVEG